jgi:small subunit ribosomal protein S15
MALSKEEKNALVRKFGKNGSDTGSAAVQIAILSKRIADLTAHLKANQEDANAKRSLMTLVGKRHSLLNFLANSDREAYEKLLASLGMKK